MTTRGRKPTPIELKLLRGNPGKRPIKTSARQSTKAEEALTNEPPSMLLDEAKSYWDYAVLHAPRSLLKKLDIYLLAAWCNAASRYEHNMRMAAKSDVIPVRGAKLAGLEAKDRPVMHNPFSAAARAYLKDMAMLASELGFTPTSRARLGAFEPETEPTNPWLHLGSA